MKTRKFLSITLAFLATTITLLGCEKETAINPDKLPKEILNYISTHFPDNPIKKAVVDKEWFKKTYEIMLYGNIELEFNRNKEIVDIEAESKLPDSVIPDLILQYVIENYPDNYIIKWELEYKSQEIKLNNGLELVFDMDGNFLRIDD
ncbi:MAG: PepSY-like domain-containing protein [Bacteroidales bacterium]